MTLPSGSYQAEWLDPRSGAASSAGSAAAGSNAFTLPSADDWVLHIHP